MNSSISELPLKPFHLPEAVSWWPLAPIWWIIIGLLILLPIAGFYFIRWRKQRLITTAHRMLNRIKSQYQQHQDGSRLVKDISIFLRQSVISILPRQKNASLTGESWLLLLDQLGNTQNFSKGKGKILLMAPYQRNDINDVEELVNITVQWVEVAYQKKIAKTVNKKLAEDTVNV